MKNIKNWNDFSENIRPNGCRLLKDIERFPSSVLVAGCQRSGTTVLARVVRNSEGFAKFQLTEDDELDAAIILSGQVDYHNSQRHCFQTTYLNECYTEYLDISESHKIIWLIRNPLSVVYSLLYNWSRKPLNNLFKGCALGLLSDSELKKYNALGPIAISRLRKAILSYIAKSEQIIYMADQLDPSRLLVVDYIDLVCNKEKVLPAIFSFIKHDYKECYKDMIHSRSVNKGSKLSEKEAGYVEEFCLPFYQRTQELALNVMD